MNRIENIEQLRAEITRLKGLAESQEKQLKDDVMAVREDMKPANLILKAIAHFTGIKIPKNDFMREGLLYALSMLSQRFVLKTEKRVEDMLYSAVDKIIEKVKEFINRHTSHDAKREERNESRSESADPTV